MPLETSDLAALFAALVDTESVSGGEARLADSIERTLRLCAHLDVFRDGNTVVATNLVAGAPSRVVIAGHIDTVPVAGALPSRWVDAPDGPVLYGRGACDMKGGVAVMLHLATRLTRPARQIVWVFYDHEEDSAESNGLGRLARLRPDLLRADLAILMEPTAAGIEGGCQGTLRFEVVTTGVAAHSARSWMGHNAIHDLAGVLERLLGARDRFGEPVEVDGLTYRPGLNATVVRGGTAGNVIPDRCALQVNYRFPPNVATDEAEAAMRRLFDGYEVDVLDLSGGARPGLDRPAAREFATVVGAAPRPKDGWTDVARFAALGVPALNYGPGDPAKAHAADENAPLADLLTCARALRQWLSHMPDDGEFG
jgi:succinyl-diaminopimelate desuccinylase